MSFAGWLVSLLDRLGMGAGAGTTPVVPTGQVCGTVVLSAAAGGSIAIAPAAGGTVTMEAC